MTVFPSNARILQELRRTLRHLTRPREARKKGACLLLKRHRVGAVLGAVLKIRHRRGEPPVSQTGREEGLCQRER